MIVLKVIDMFSGVGGLSLGAVKAGFDLVGAVELDKKAIETHNLNFPKSKHFNYDISKLTGHKILEEAGLRSEDLSGLIGGPPCQGFSLMGKQDINDPRNELFIHFFRLVNEMEPVFFLAENVPGILNEKFVKIRNKALGLIEEKYHTMQPIVLNAQDYGVPTSRARVFFIGVKKGYPKLYPEIFHPDSSIKTNYVKDAFEGLPVQLEEIPASKSKQLIWNKIKKPIKGSYSERLSKTIPKGIGNQEAIFRYKKLFEVSGIIGTMHTKEVRERYEKVEPGTVDRISRSYRLKMNGFCPTLRAGTDQEHGSYQAVRPLHPIEGRVINPREAARLQGFPDWFVFHPTKWHSFRQIGNSVSPILAEYILKKIKNHITEANISGVKNREVKL